MKGAGFWFWIGGVGEGCGGFAVYRWEFPRGAENDAGCGVEQAAYRPGAVGVGEENFTGTLFFGAVVPAFEEGEGVAPFGGFGIFVGAGLSFESSEEQAGAVFRVQMGGEGSCGGVGGESDAGLGDGREHEGLGEEAGAYGGLFADGADAEGGEPRWADEAAVVEEEDGGICGCRGVVGAS